jgi:hypothetical protein
LFVVEGTLQLNNSQQLYSLFSSHHTVIH